ncbi:helix-turn-helix domain-containing protein [Peribacillus phoenicis]|uniref:helix-turn-helix domain-containing protein n=1 Tax=unclassified Peribacillus TaxID=2675266 RepID=UPI0039A3D1CF
MNVKEFGAYLKELRKSKSLSTHKLAELSGVSQSYISHVENGRKSNVPSTEILKKLARALGVSTFDLIEKAGHLPDISPMERERLNVNYDVQAQLEPQLERALQIIAKDNEFIAEVQEDIRELEKFYDNHLEIDEKITPLFLRDLVENFDWDEEWILILVSDINKVSRKYDPNDLKNILARYTDLTTFLNQPNVTYNNKLISSEHKKIILTMVEALFAAQEKEGQEDG